MPFASGGAATLGRGGAALPRGSDPVVTAPPAVAPARVADRGAGRTSYARRLTFSRCRGEMLSEVMLPPQPPQPRVIAGSSPVVRPIDPCVVGVLTQMRNAGLRSPKARMTSSFFEWIDIV